MGTKKDKNYSYGSCHRSTNENKMGTKNDKNYSYEYLHRAVSKDSLVSEYVNLMSTCAVDLPCPMQKGQFGQIWGGQTERSEEKEQNLDTGLLKCAECGTPQQKCDMKIF
jgi:hypothetical protein